MAQQASQSLLMSLSSELAGVVESLGPSIVRIDDGSRLTATGLVWSADGIIVTTSHGVERDEDLAIELADGARLAATLVGRDPDTDIAVLRVAASGLPAIRRAPPEEVKVGHLVLALGRPGSAGLQATIGIIGARIDSQNNGQPEYVLHTDAVLYPGFSGGALVNVQGQVVGLTNLMFGRGKGVALGTPILQNIVDALLAHGRVQRGYLGVRTQLVGLQEHLVKTLRLTQERGLLLVQVEADGPAERGGLLLGDVLLRLNGTPVEDVDALRNTLRRLHAGQKVSLEVLRGGTVQPIEVVLGAEA